MRQREDDEKESLLTEKALQLSLSAPRCAPFGTAHRSVMFSSDPSADPYVDHHNDQAHSDYNLHSGIRERLMHLIYNASLDPHSLPHPHLPVGLESSDNMTRFLGSILPLKWQNHVRDSGGFRIISHSLISMAFPPAVVSNPSAARIFLQLTNQVHTLRYGSHHESQFVDVFFPPNVPRDEVTGMVFFVHGGAWGSGKPLFYRLAARPFLKLNLAVAIVGYRVYPDGNVNVQVRDLELAYQQLSEEYPDLCGPSRTHHPIGLVVVGHSSGAHIALMMIVEQVKRLLLVQEENLEIRNVPLVDKWVGLSGPYDVSHHFDYEAARGVEEFSPLKPACGYSREQFRKNSPALRLQDFLASIQEHRELCPNLFFPSTLLVHGMEDSTVPFTATSEAARLLRACGLSNVDEYYVPRGGHPDTVMELMLGGKVPRAIVKWLTTDAASQEAPIRSKL